MGGVIDGDAQIVRYRHPCELPAAVRDTRDAVRAQWGEKGVIDLAFALQMGRMYPMMKAALGYAKECRRISVDGKQIDVVKQAA